MLSRTGVGIWLLQFSGQHRHGHCKTKYCRHQAPAVATPMLALTIRVVGHLPDRWMNALRSRKVPTCLHAKLHTSARKPEHAAHPAQMLKLRRSQEFPEIVGIGSSIPICGIVPSRPRTAALLDSDLEAARQHRGPPSMPPRQESTNRKRQTIPSRSRRTGAPQAAVPPDVPQASAHSGHPRSATVAADARPPGASAHPRRSEDASQARGPGPRWVRMASVTAGPARARAVTSGEQESQVTWHSPPRPRTPKRHGTGFEPLTRTAAPGLPPLPTREGETTLEYPPSSTA